MFEELKAILSAKLKVAPEAIVPEASHEEIELDSLAVVELSLLLETEVGVRISDDELLEAGSVGGIVLLMEERSAKI